jgi:hypothetical protein
MGWRSSPWLPAGRCSAAASSAAPAGRSRPRASARSGKVREAMLHHLRHQHRTCGTVLAEPMGALHRFAPDVVDQLRLADDAGDDVTGVDAEPRCKRRAMAAGKTLSSSRSFSWFLWSTRAVWVCRLWTTALKERLSSPNSSWELDTGMLASSPADTRRALSIRCWIGLLNRSVRAIASSEAARAQLGQEGIGTIEMGAGGGTHQRIAAHQECLTRNVVDLVGGHLEGQHPISREPL